MTNVALACAMVVKGSIPVHEGSAALHTCVDASWQNRLLSDQLQLSSAFQEELQWFTQPLTHKGALVL